MIRAYLDKMVTEIVYIKYDYEELFMKIDPTSGQLVYTIKTKNGREYNAHPATSNFAVEALLNGVEISKDLFEKGPQDYVFDRGF